MSLFDQAEFETFVSSRAGVTLVDQWDSRVAKVGGKVFCLLYDPAGEKRNIVFKVPEESFEILTAIDGVGQAPYFARRQWVAVARHADLPEPDLRTYILRSYDTVARSLTRMLRSELGILLER